MYRGTRDRSDVEITQLVTAYEFVYWLMTLVASSVVLRDKDFDFNSHEVKKVAVSSGWSVGDVLTEMSLSDIPRMKEVFYCSYTNLKLSEIPVFIETDDYDMCERSLRAAAISVAKLFALYTGEDTGFWDVEGAMKVVERTSDAEAKKFFSLVFSSLLKLQRLLGEKRDEKEYIDAVLETMWRVLKAFEYVLYAYFLPNTFPTIARARRFMP